MEKDLPQRKPTRLKNFDYNKIGAYIITICTENRRQILSRIEKTKFAFGEMDLRYIHENPMRWFYDELYTEE